MEQEQNYKLPKGKETGETHFREKEEKLNKKKRRRGKREGKGDCCA